MYTRDLLFGFSFSNQTAPYQPLMHILPLEIWGHVIKFLVLGDEQHAPNTDNFNKFIRICKQCYILAIDSLEVCKFNLYFMRLQENFRMEKFKMIHTLPLPKKNSIFTPLLLENSYVFGSQNEGYKVDFDKGSITAFSIDSSREVNWAFRLSTSDILFFSSKGVLLIYDSTLTQKHICLDKWKDKWGWMDPQLVDDVLYSTAMHEDKSYSLNLIEYINSNYTKCPIECQPPPEKPNQYPSLVLVPSDHGFIYYSLLSSTAPVWRHCNCLFPQDSKLLLASLRCENSLPYLYGLILRQRVVDGVIAEPELQLGRFELTPAPQNQLFSFLQQLLFLPLDNHFLL